MDVLWIGYCLIDHMPFLKKMSDSLTVANFLLALEKENDWRTLGIFLDVEDCILDEIERLYESKGIRRCKEELFKVLKQREEYPTWEEIAGALDKVGNRALAKEIHEKYINLSSNDQSSSMEVTPSLRAVDLQVRSSNVNPVKVSTVRKLEKLHVKFAKLVDDVREQLNAKVSVDSLRTFIRVHLQLEISLEITSINEVFEILCPHFCFIQYYCLEDLVDAFLGDCESLKQVFKSYKQELKILKEACIKTLCSEI